MNVHIVVEAGRPYATDFVLERDDLSLSRGNPSLEKIWLHSSQEFFKLFLKNTPALSYLLSLIGKLALVTHPIETKTAKEKAQMLGWERSRVIKTLYYKDKLSGDIFAVVVPEQGEVDLKATKQVLTQKYTTEFSPKNRLRLLPENELPFGMAFGTCTPFLPAGQESVAGVFFDTLLIDQRRTQTGLLDDFSIALGIDNVPDTKLSAQVNYATAFDTVAEQFPGRVHAVEFSYKG